MIYWSPHTLYDERPVQITLPAPSVPAAAALIKFVTLTTTNDHDDANTDANGNAAKNDGRNADRKDDETPMNYKL